MSQRGEPAFDLQSFRGPLDARTLDRFKVVIPDDQLKDKRERNLSRARAVIVALDHDVPVGLVFVRTIAGIPNVTWLVAERARRRGLAVRMLMRLQEECSCLTALCRNEASLGVARRAGFVIGGPFAVWFGRRRR